MSTRLSLAQQLLQLDNPAPIDVDPEDVYTTSRQDKEEDDILDQFVENNEHYVEVGPSSLRKLHESLNDPKYAGKKTSRKLGETPMTDSEEENEVSEDDQDEFGSARDAPASESSDESHDRDESEDESNINEHVEESGSSLKRAREGDRLKGQAIIRQLAIWDSLLDARIRLQKASSLCNTLPKVSSLHNLISTPEGLQESQKFLYEALMLSEELFTLQKDLQSGTLEQPDEKESPPRKRRKLDIDSVDDYTLLEQSITDSSYDLAVLQSSSHSHHLATLNKWSAKIQAVIPATLLPSARNSFKANKNSHLKSVTELIDDSLADRGRILLRTQTRRGAHRIDQTIVPPTTDVEGKVLEDKDLEVFDDTDFYQQLLRDIIDRQGGSDLVDNEIINRPRKVKKLVDTRASKGRKLRYEVHEKLQNFMVPIPTTGDGWHEEKIDELFASLLGRTLRKDAVIEDSLHKEANVALVRDGFRIFG